MNKKVLINNLKDFQIALGYGMIFMITLLFIHGYMGSRQVTIPENNLQSPQSCTPIAGAISEINTNKINKAEVRRPLEEARTC